MEELQKKYAEFQVIEKQLKMVSDQIQELNSKMMELEYISQSVAELSTLKEGTEILAPFSSGIFVRATIQKANEFLVNVGTGTVVKKSLEETQGLLQKQAEDIESLRMELIAQATKLSEQSEALEKELKGLIGNVSVPEGEA